MNSTPDARLVLDAEGMSRVMDQVAHQIIDRNQDASDFAIVGIRRRGDWLAKRLVERISTITGVNIPVGALDINLYRDDFQMRTSQPVVRTSEIHFAVEDRTIVLVDDVLYTGRTIRAALDELTDYGRPKCIQLAVLINRDGRELPIQADYFGAEVPIGENEIVVVHVQEVDGIDNVAVERIER